MRSWSRRSAKHRAVPNALFSPMIPGHGHSARVQCVFRRSGQVGAGEVDVHLGNPGLGDTSSGRE